MKKFLHRIPMKHWVGGGHSDRFWGVRRARRSLCCVLQNAACAHFFEKRKGGKKLREKGGVVSSISLSCAPQERRMPCVAREPIGSPRGCRRGWPPPPPRRRPGSLLDVRHALDLGHVRVDVAVSYCLCCVVIGRCVWWENGWCVGGEKKRGGPRKHNKKQTAAQKADGLALRADSARLHSLLSAPKRALPHSWIASSTTLRAASAPRMSSTTTSLCSFFL